MRDMAQQSFEALPETIAVDLPGTRIDVKNAAMSDGAPHLLSPLSHIGNVGVRFFFVISGFLITTLLLKEQAKAGTISLKQFYFRRAVRILPAFLTFMAFLGVLQVLGVVSVDAKWCIRQVTGRSERRRHEVDGATE